MNDLATLQSSLPAPVDSEYFKEITKVSEFHPRLQLYGGNSDACKEGKIGIGRFGLVAGKDDITDLTNEVLILPLTRRYKAMDISNKEAIITVFDHKSKAFTDIVAKSEEQDSGCMFGPEYLVWIDPLKTFATYYMNSKTARREAGKVESNLLKALLLKAELIVTKKYKWHGPKVVVSSDQLDGLPDMEIIKREMEKFLAEKGTETVSEEEQAATSRER